MLLTNRDSRAGVRGNTMSESNWWKKGHFVREVISAIVILMWIVAVVGFTALSPLAAMGRLVSDTADALFFIFGFVLYVLYASKIRLVVLAAYYRIKYRKAGELSYDIPPIESGHEQNEHGTTGGTQQGLPDYHDILVKASFLKQRGHPHTPKFPVYIAAPHLLKEWGPFSGLLRRVGLSGRLPSQSVLPNWAFHILLIDTELTLKREIRTGDGGNSEVVYELQVDLDKARYGIYNNDGKRFLDFIYLRERHGSSDSEQDAGECGSEQHTREHSFEQYIREYDTTRDFEFFKCRPIDNEARRAAIESLDRAITAFLEGDEVRDLSGGGSRLSHMCYI